MKKAYKSRDIAVNSRFLTQQITGVQRAALEISRYLRKLAPDIEYIAPKNILNKRAAKELNAISCGSLKGHLWEQTELIRYLKKQDNPLLINPANTAPLFYKRQIVTIHDMSWLRNPSWFSKKFYYLYKFLIPKIAKNSLTVVTVSEFSKKEIMNLLEMPEEKIRVVHNAISGAFSNMLKMPPKKNNNNYVLAVSSIDPRKNLNNLLLSFNKLNLKNMKLVVAGSENKIFAQHKLRNLISINKNITFTGYISEEEMVDLYRNAKLFVFPSLYEGFGLPPLEAMACGCPVIASNVASLPEVCGDAAYYVAPYDVESIAEGMYKVLTDDNLKQNLIKKGFERVKLFSWEKSAEEYIKVFDEVMGTYG